MPIASRPGLRHDVIMMETVAILAAALLALLGVAAIVMVLWAAGDEADGTEFTRSGPGGDFTEEGRRSRRIAG